MNTYEDIIHTVYPFPGKRSRMSMDERAAQFASFAALTGHEEAIHETARYTDSQSELSEEEKEKIDFALQELRQHFAEHPQIKLTFFRPDLKKSGGTIESISCQIKKIDEIGKNLILFQGEIIPFSFLIEIEIDKKKETETI